MSRLHGVVCYWEFVPATAKFKRDDSKWELVESFAIDGDGHCLTMPSTGGDDRREYHKWTNELIYYLENDLSKLGNCERMRGEGEWFTKTELIALGIPKETIERLDEDWRPIMGRAVTLWTIEHGVGLLDIHPPDDFPVWLSSSFYEELCKLPNWMNLLQQGHCLYFGTTKEALKYITLKEKPESPDLAA